MSRPVGDALLEDLAAAVGQRHVLVDADLRAPFETDWTRRWHGRAACVVRPGSTEEVAAVLAACRRHGAAIVPQGGNTGLVGGGVPHDGEVVVSTTRLDELEPVDAGAAQVTVGAGVRLARLHEHAAASGLAYGVDFAARDSATVGGTVATNAGGIRVVRHGSTRQQVVGIEAVLPDGGVVRRLEGLVKENVGYDLAGLLTGSEGTLGIVTRVRLRLVAPPAESVAALLAVDGLPDALRLFARLRDGLDALDAVEYLEDEGLALVEARTSASAPFPSRHPAYLLVETSGNPAPVERLAELLEDAGELRDAAVGDDAPSRARLWQLRDAQTEAIASVGVAAKYDVALPLRALPEFRERLEEVLAVVAPDAHAIVFGHLGEGNLHVNVLGAGTADERALDEAVLGEVLRLEGAISAEHGIGRHKVAFLARARSQVDLAAMRAIKRALDPDGRCNPGVLLP